MTAIRDIVCRCGHLLAQRQGDVLIYHTLRLRLRRSHDIECPVCGAKVVFDVNQHRNEKHIDQVTQKG